MNNLIYESKTGTIYMLEVLVSKKKLLLADKWVNLIFDTYSKETSRFLKVQTNQFSNPVGHTVNTAANLLLDELTGSLNPGTVKPLLIDLIKIRAVQDFSPSKATGFIFLLKKVIREVFKEELYDKEYSDELFVLDSKIDQLALIAFDLYQECRETIYKIRLNEIKSGSVNVFAEAGIV